MKIGVIVPHSTLFPIAGMHFSDGVHLAVKRYGSDKDSVVIENAGNAANVEKVQDAANKLLLQEKVDVLVGYVGHNMFEVLADICSQYKKILILADMGAVLTYKLKPSPYVFTHSLNEWAASYKLGKLIAINYKTMLPAVSFMDAGYSLSYAAIAGYEKSGGSVSGYHMAKLQIDQEYFDTFHSIVNDAQPAVVLAAFTGKDADNFLDGVKTTLAETGVQLAGSGWLTIPETLEKYGALLNGTKTASAYYTSIDSDANKTFIKEYEAYTENDANTFSLLGYEIGMMLLKSAKYKDDGRLSAQQTIEGLEQQKLDSPRGSVSYHPEKHYAISGYWMAEVVKEGDTYINKITENIQQADMEDWRADEKNWPNGGWYNPYPCT